MKVPVSASLEVWLVLRGSQCPRDPQCYYPSALEPADRVHEVPMSALQSELHWTYSDAVIHLLKYYCGFYLHDRDISSQNCSHSPCHPNALANFYRTQIKKYKTSEENIGSIGRCYSTQCVYQWNVWYLTSSWTYKMSTSDTVVCDFGMDIDKYSICPFFRFNALHWMYSDTVLHLLKCYCTIYLHIVTYQAKIAPILSTKNLHL